MHRRNGNLDFDFKACCQRWALAMDGFERIKKDNSIQNYMLIRYEDLTSKTLLAASDPELSTYIGKRAREITLNYSLDNLVNTYESTLRGVEEQYLE
jgi:hypothetical protein